MAIMIDSVGAQLALASRVKNCTRGFESRRLHHLSAKGDIKDVYINNVK